MIECLRREQLETLVVAGVRKAQKEQNNKHIGYNVLTDTYGDMFSFGIADPAKVTRSALQNAASIAAMVLSTDTLITDSPEEEGAAEEPQTRPASSSSSTPASELKGGVGGDSGPLIKTQASE